MADRVIEEHNDTCFIVKNAQVTGYLLPTNFGGAFHLRQPDPDLAEDQPGDAQFLFCRRRPRTIQALTISLMARFVTGRKKSVAAVEPHGNAHRLRRHGRQWVG